MKLHALMIAAALVAGTAFAQAPNGSATAPADKQGTAMNSDTKAAGSMDKPAKVHKKKVAKKHSARSHKQHAGMHRGAQAMGAGPASPTTDLDAGSRQSRMDQAYADFRARVGR